MPANPKHLTKSNWQRFAKITSGILGGYVLSFLAHACFLSWFDGEMVMETATYSLFILWIPLLIFPFLFKNGWHCWFIYLGIALVLLTLLNFL
ncbi:hypothetical protein [Flavivirga jejuensis]|uniref:Uncharacterized protein n=1 Tax=Flavivirga jejuensis TaxID=870487 RepID=A0ABT8WT18_9FLAO|nr:hypothetical protein [Flavivirga jejuensis]MDO5976328.1 hypothetical protein [Flavivirga jejuensis]